MRSQHRSILTVGGAPGASPDPCYPRTHRERRIESQTAPPTAASNLANIDTPGYRTQDLDFEQALKAALGQGQGQSLPMARTHDSHLGGDFEVSMAVIHPGKPVSERNDGNDVSLDRESMLLARTQSNYQVAALLAQGELRKMRLAITESLAH